MPKYDYLEVDKLLEHSGNCQSNKFNGTTINQESHASTAMAKIEWESFQKFMQDI